MAFIYCADIYCDACGQAIRDRLTAEGNAPVDPDDEYSYDSDEFPKCAGDDEESDCPQHCGSHGDCLDPTILPDGRKIGHFFANQLTTDGMEYVAETLREAHGEFNDVRKLWATEYGFPIGQQTIELAKLRAANGGELPEYAWPGGYPIAYIVDDCDACCAQCANGSNGAQFHEITTDSQWRLTGFDVNYENPSGEHCCHCNKILECAYPAESTESPDA